ncbi:MAG: hypothetical protein HYZ84_02510 [Candidatus Omnitrophica bacterium]|nr:hypothetical protein [Candidatus Omnitrophota bacterium]
MTDTLRLVSALLPLSIIPIGIGHALTHYKEPWPTAWWVGTLCIGLFLLIGHGLNIPFAILFAIIAFGFVASLFLTELPQNRFYFDRLRSLSFHHVGTTSLILVFLAMNYVQILSHPLDPFYSDTLSIWFNKAKGLFFDIPFAVLPVPGFSMANYPHLGPVYEMFVMKFAGLPIEPIARLIFPTVYFVWILSLAQIPVFKNHPRLLWLLPVIALVFYDAPAYTSGYQDGFLAATAGMAALQFILFLNTSEQDLSKSKTHLWLAIFFAGSLSFIKVEGTVLAIILTAAFCLIAILFHFQNNLISAWRFLWPFFGLLTLMVLCWPGLLLIHHLDATKISGPAYTYRDIFTFYQNFDRWPLIEKHFAVYVQSRLSFILATTLLSAATFCMHVNLRPGILFLWMVWTAHLSFIAVAFLATRLPLEWHLQTAFERLSFQHFFVYVTATAHLGALWETR